MNELDESILEFLESLGTPAGEPVVIAPKDVWLNLNVLRGMTDKASNTVSRRMSRLESIGMLERVGDRGRHYHITDMGLSYLAGDLDAGDIPEPDD